MRHIASAFVALLVAACPVAAEKPPAEPMQNVAETRDAMGTHITLTVVAPDDEIGRGHIEAAFERIAQLERVLSSHSPDSELARLNAAAGKGPVRVSDDLFAVVQAGVAWHKRSRQAFDITVGPLLEVWRNAAKAGRLPSEAELEAARKRLGADEIILDPAAKTIAIPRADIKIDLGGLGKGYTADAVVKLLKQRRVKGALIAMSGDIYALGVRDDGRPWRVGIQDPRRPDDPAALLGVLELSDRAVSTSGNYQRYVEIEGKRYSHIVDPRTGRTCEAIPSDTVVAADTLTTDIMDTALNVLGVEEGLKLAKEGRDVEAMFITMDEKGEPRFVRSKGFSKYEASRP